VVGLRSACRLYLRSLDQLDPQSRARNGRREAPFFSPDGRWVAFFADGKLRKVSLAGGMPVAVAEAPQTFGGVWLPDGDIVFAASEHGGLLRVSDQGGSAVRSRFPPPKRASTSQLAGPGAGRTRAALHRRDLAGRRVPARIAMMPIGQRSAWQTIIDNADIARAVSQGYIAFSRGREIHAVAFDRARQAIAGTDETVIGNVARMQFALASSGAITYATGADSSRPSLTWIPATGTAVLGDVAALQDLALVADGSRVAGVSNGDLWVGDVSRGTTTRLTHGGTNVSPVWSRDGASVYYAAGTGGSFEAWTRDSSGTSPAKLTVSAAARHRHVFPSSVSRDGQLMAYTESGGPPAVTQGCGACDRRDSSLVETPFDETHGALSPDGRLLAYQSDESGRWEIYLLKLDDRQRIPISSGGAIPCGPPTAFAVYRPRTPCAGD
jgi:serine/threonine-protein kinase